MVHKCNIACSDIQYMVTSVLSIAGPTIRKKMRKGWRLVGVLIRNDGRLRGHMQVPKQVLEGVKGCLQVNAQKKVCQTDSDLLEIILKKPGICSKT